jgi:hypothetical protein
LNISEEIIVVMAREFDKEIIELLLDQQPDIQLTEKIIYAVAESWQGTEVISLLIDRQRAVLSVQRCAPGCCR